MSLTLSSMSLSRVSCTSRTQSASEVMHDAKFSLATSHACNTLSKFSNSEAPYRWLIVYSGQRDEEQGTSAISIAVWSSAPSGALANSSSSTSVFLPSTASCTALQATVQVLTGRSMTRTSSDWCSQISSVQTYKSLCRSSSLELSEDDVL